MFNKKGLHYRKDQNKYNWKKKCSGICSLSVIICKNQFHVVYKRSASKSAWEGYRYEQQYFFLFPLEQKMVLFSLFVNSLQCKWLQVEEFVEVEAGGDVARERWDAAVAHVDMGPDFWRKHPYIFNKW